MKQRYELLIKQLDALLENETNTIANLSNASALLFHSIDHVNWAGFYLVDNEELILGPFQGKVACMHIKLGKGVCGTCASTREIQCIGNVHQFEGHSACDGDSNSEIVVPIIIDKKLYGVLDIDSYDLNNFNEVDVRGLEKFVLHLCRHIY